VVRKRTDLALVMALAVAACVFAALLPPGLAVLRVPLALPLVLGLPGYAIVAALFAPGALRTAEILMLSLAVSVAATIFVGLLLDALSVRLTAGPWMDLLAAITVAAAIRASGRGHARDLVLPRMRLRAVEIGALSGALILVSAAAVLGLTPLAPPKGTPGTTALWLVPAPAARRRLRGSDQRRAAERDLHRPGGRGGEAVATVRSNQAGLRGQLDSRRHRRPRPAGRDSNTAQGRRRAVGSAVSQCGDPALEHRREELLIPTARRAGNAERALDSAPEGTPAECDQPQSQRTLAGRPR
jgi:hypothetical protein